MKQKMAAPFIFAALLAAGCATPVNRIPETDFAWRTATLPISYQAAYRNVREGFRTCDAGVADGDVYSDVREAKVTVYMDRETAIVQGVIYVTPGGPRGGSLVRMGVVRSFGSMAPGARERQLELYERLARGDYSACKG